MPVCHALLQNPQFFRWLLRVDAELAGDARAVGCACGGVLHRADYPRKPRGCPPEMRTDFATRFSFCCNRCRRRTTSMSVRFLGRRVYLALLVIPLGTLERWRQWWKDQFPRSTFWQASGARFMPPVTERFPTILLERFVGDAATAMRHLVLFRTPITVQPAALRGGC